MSLNSHARVSRGTPTNLLTTHAGPVSVVLAFSSDVLRRGLRSMLESLPDVTSIAECGNLTEADALTMPYAPNKVVICSPTAVEALGQGIPVGTTPGTRFLVLMPDARDETIAQVTSFPADGYILEPGLTQEALGEAISQLLDGEIPIPKMLVRELLMVRRDGRGGRAKRTSTLTPREAQVLELMVDGMSNKEIAVHLGVSSNAAKRHVANVLAKLNCRNRTHAVATVLSEGIFQNHSRPASR